MGRAAKVAMALIFLTITFIAVANLKDSYDLNKDAQHDVDVAKAEVEQAKQDCYQARSDFIANYGELPEQLKNRSCETGQ